MTNGMCQRTMNATKTLVFPVGQPTGLRAGPRLAYSLLLSTSRAIRITDKRAQKKTSRLTSEIGMEPTRPR